MVGRTGLVYAAMGGIFATVEDTLVSLRDGRKDIWNGATAGCAAGMVFGVSSQKLSVGAGMCASLAATSAFLEAVNLTMGPTVRVPPHEKRTFFAGVSESWGTGRGQQVGAVGGGHGCVVWSSAALVW